LQQSVAFFNIGEDDAPPVRSRRELLGSTLGKSERRGGAAPPRLNAPLSSAAVRGGSGNFKPY
jgi:hypothetical protein